MDPQIYYKLDSDLNVVPATREEWFNIIENRADSRIAATNVGLCWVSTVFLGLNHGFNPTEAPLVFETMVFPREWMLVPHEGLPDLMMERYSTIDEARLGHERHVAMARDWRVQARAVGVALEGWWTRITEGTLEQRFAKLINARAGTDITNPATMQQKIEAIAKLLKDAEDALNRATPDDDDQEE